MLNKGRPAERGRGSVISAGSESHRDPHSNQRAEAFGWFNNTGLFVDWSLKWIHYHQLGIIFVITSQTAEHNVVLLNPSEGGAPPYEPGPAQGFFLFKHLETIAIVTDIV